MTRRELTAVVGGALLLAVFAPTPLSPAGAAVARELVPVDAVGCVRTVVTALISTAPSPWGATPCNGGNP